MPSTNEESTKNDILGRKEKTKRTSREQKYIKDNKLKVKDRHS